MLSDRWADLVQSQLADIPRRRRGLLLFMAVSAAGGIFAAKGASTAAISWASAALLVLAGCGGVWFLIDMLRDSRPGRELRATSSFLQVRPIGGRYVIGVSIERGHIQYGALELTGDPNEPLGNVRVVQLGRPKTRQWIKPLEAYSEAAQGVIELLSESGERRIDGIGIAMPGLVDVARGELQSSPAGIAPAHVPREIAKAIAESDIDAASKLGLDLDIESLTRNVGGFIAIDNDARCMGRFLANVEPKLKNFVSVFVGKGVGSAVILDGRLYFGSHGFAGEYGHHILGLDRRIAMPKSGGELRDLVTPACGCHRKGAHYECLVNDAGLIRLARFFDSELYLALSDHLTSDQDLQGESLIEVAVAMRSDERTPASDLLISLTRGDHKRILRFFDSLENTYVQFLAMGLANVINLLDVDNAFLSGPLIEMFDRLPQFRDNVQQSIKKYLLREDRVNLRIRADAGSHMWIGAGLLFRDSAYAEAAGHSGDLLGGRHLT